MFFPTLTKSHVYGLLHINIKLIQAIKSDPQYLPLYANAPNIIGRERKEKKKPQQEI
jgi:hypothetical protein